MNKLDKKEKDFYNKAKFAYITDDNYVLPTIVSITSLFTNKRKDSNYEVFLILNNISQENKLLLENLKKEFSSIHIINGESYIKNYEWIKQKRHVSTSALIKFFLPQILKNEEKILYIDDDTIIQNDLTEVFNTDITKFYAGVIKDTFTITSKEYIKKYNLNCVDYFNSGVMLLNLSRLRNENVPQKLIEDKQHHQTMFMDQDTFNKIFANKVLFLSYRYNFLNYYLEKFSTIELSKFFGEKMPQNENKLYKSCNILHFGGINKPWTHDMDLLSKIYKNYYNKTILKNKKLILQKCPYTRTFIEKLFSIKNQTRRNIKYKNLTILGKTIILKITQITKN